ncbi:MAG: hypothetical protein IKQ49_04935 [Eubacterium sp.]|nr:hypothetical protein [Eubacterium sp.]
MSDNVRNINTDNKEEINLDEYEAAYMPDTGHLLELLKLCKGGRPWKDFAELCGKSPATFSRLSNKKITKQVSKDILLAAYQNQVDPGNPELDELMKAGGWRKIKKRTPRPPMERYEPTEEERAQFDKMERDDENRRRMINLIIRSELDARGQMNLFYDNRRGRWGGRNPAMNDEKIMKSRFGLRYVFPSSGFTIQIQGMEPRYWCFFPLYSVISGRKRDWGKYTQEEMEQKRNYSLRDVMTEGFNELFLKDIWEPETLADIKSTVIFHDRVEYEMVWEVLKTRTVNNWFSLLLIDLDEEKVLDEKILPRADGKDRQEESIFKQEPNMSTYEKWDDFPDDEFRK